MTRAPKQQVEAVLKNLEWCASLSQRAAENNEGHDSPDIAKAVHGLFKEADAWRQACALIRTECQQILSEAAP